MALDELLRLTGTSGDPEEDISATGAGTPIFVGKDRSFVAHARVGGDVTGTNPTLDLKIQRSASASGTWTDVVSFAQITDEQVGYVASTTPKYDAAPGEDPLTVVFTTTEDYIRIYKTIGGTSTPTFNDVSVEVQPIKGFAYKRSGT